MTEDFETGSIHVIEAIQWWLRAKVEETKGNFPPTLFIQVDNCSRENVARGTFHEIQISFLLHGHTHEDIDQAFSCTSRFLRVHEAVTRDFVSCLQKSYHPAPTVLEMNAVANFSGLLEDGNFLLPATGKITTFRFFDFTRSQQTVDSLHGTTVAVKKSVPENFL